MMIKIAFDDEGKKRRKNRTYIHTHKRIDSFSVSLLVTLFSGHTLLRFNRILESCFWMLLKLGQNTDTCFLKQSWSRQYVNTVCKWGWIRDIVASPIRANWSWTERCCSLLCTCSIQRRSLRGVEADGLDVTCSYPRSHTWTVSGQGGGDKLLEK